MKTTKGFQGSLYTIDRFDRDDDGSRFILTIRLNPEHEIFKGHFPGNPVLPGACTVQILKELAEFVLKRDLFISEAGTIKYISFVDPGVHTNLEIDLTLKEKEDGHLSCIATVRSEAITFCSFKGILAPRSKSTGG